MESGGRGVVGGEGFVVGGSVGGGMGSVRVVVWTVGAEEG